MFNTLRSAMAVVFSLAAVSLVAAPPPALKDAFLDNVVGDWRVNRKMGNGRLIETSVHGEWVLKHQFIELHYGAGEREPEYEALVFIGFDEVAKTYVCHWVDVFGGQYSGIGHGKLDPNLLGIEFRFQFKDGALTNKFVFNPDTKSWASLIRQEENGQWKTFAEEKWSKR